MTLEEEKQAVMDCRDDLQAFTTFYTNYVEDVYRYAYSRLLDKSSAEDITQNAFMIALEKIKTYEHNGVSSIKSWFFGIARNLMLNKYKKKEAENGFDEDFTTSFNDERILEKAISKDLLKNVTSFIETLSPTIQEVIRLRVWDEMSFAEIADILGKNESAVKMAFYRGLEKIYKEFEEEVAK